MSEKSHVSMEHHVCIVCTKKFPTGTILMDTRIDSTTDRLRSSLESDIVTDFGMCPVCAEQASKGFIALVEIDPSQSRDPAHNERIDPSQAYRTGNVAWINREAAQRIFPDNHMPDPNEPVVFTQPGLIRMLHERVHGKAN